MARILILTPQAPIPPQALTGTAQGTTIRNFSLLAGLAQRHRVSLATFVDRDSGASAVDACAVTGRELSLEGVSLDEALQGLEVTCRLVSGTPPDFGDTRALSLGWSEATLGYLHRLTCADPATGLASLAHLQSRITELHRGQAREDPSATRTHALVVLDTLQPDSPDRHDPADAFTADLRAARFAETVRSVFGGGEVVGRLDRHRIVVLTARDAELGRRVAVVRRMLSDLEGGARVWIEGLPDTEGAARATLGELARR